MSILFILISTPSSVLDRCVLSSQQFAEEYRDKNS